MLVQQIKRAGFEEHQLLSSPHLHVSYSQFGEDLLIAHLLKQEAGFYVDVGCHDPFRFSNTCLLHRFRNWSGINIDADFRAIEAFRTIRPNDINLHVGVGAVSGKMEFTTFEDGARNSFNEKMVDHASKSVRVREKQMIEIMPLRAIFDQHLRQDQRIDYMNIDCEGLDEEVVRSNDWTKYAPHYLSVEIHGLDLSEPKLSPVVQFLHERGYKFRAHHMVTSIFQNMRW